LLKWGGTSLVAASRWQGAVDPIYQEYCPFPIAVPGDLNSDVCCLNLCPAWSILFMGISSTSGSWRPCCVMVWVLQAFILEDINIV
jgi:hypothetical protein